MKLKNLHGVTWGGLADLELSGAPITVVFEDALALPGLINSHDHLDFNLFPALKSRIYADYKEWGTDIHEHFGETIKAVLSIPLELRIRWGVYKNLLAGVTSVVHHGALLAVPEELISVLQDAESLHSVSGEKGWRRKLLHPLRRDRPLVIHTGEGTTQDCSTEIDELIRWNIFKRPLIGIHGLAMSQEQAGAFRALVWCPDSNYFLYDKTADIPMLRHELEVVFGTDSTLSASWNIWEQLRLARKSKIVEDAGLWEMVTTAPARLWSLGKRGSISGAGDLVIAERPSGSTGWDAVFGIDPERILFVVSRGEIRLFDESLLSQLTDQGFPTAKFYPVLLQDRVKYVQGDLPGLLREIRQYYSDAPLPVTAL